MKAQLSPVTISWCDVRFVSWQYVFVLKKTLRMKGKVDDLRDLERLYKKFPFIIQMINKT